MDMKFKNNNVLPWREAFLTFMAVVPPTIIIYFVNQYLPTNDFLRLAVNIILFSSVTAITYHVFGIAEYRRVITVIKSFFGKW